MWSGSSGALLCSAPILGVTQTLQGEWAQVYGGVYFVGETIKESAQKIIAHRLGCKYLEPSQAPNASQLTLSTVQVGLKFGTYQFFDAVVEHPDLRERIRTSEVVVKSRSKR
jgi:hypothetical protein